MIRDPWLIAFIGLLAASCTTIPLQGGLLSAEDHQEQARLAKTARHHAAHVRLASDLRRFEATACAPSTEPHEGHMTFLPPGGVVSVVPKYQSVTHWHRSLRGASVLVRTGDLMDLGAAKESLECHLARAAAHGWTSPGQQACPLCVPGASATTSVEVRGTMISISAKDEGGAKEILRRSRALVGTPTTD